MEDSKRRNIFLTIQVHRSVWELNFAYTGNGHSMQQKVVSLEHNYTQLDFSQGLRMLFMTVCSNVDLFLFAKLIVHTYLYFTKPPFVSDS